MSRAVVLAARPDGEPRESDFEIRELPERELRDGEVRVRNTLVSVDPYMRSRMAGIRTYIDPFDVGDVIEGSAVGTVVESRDPRFARGDSVVSLLGWREEGVARGRELRRLDRESVSPSAALGVLGMPGLTAWIGLLEVGRVRGGETVYVSGAAGAVGSVAVQIARIKGLRVIGSAGTPEKVEWLRSLGVEAFDYRVTSTREALADGIDVFFDNVGGEQLEAALFALREHGRVIACGAISRYNDAAPVPGPRNLALVVSKRIRIQGFIVLDHFARFPEFSTDARTWFDAGQLVGRETIVDGLENIPSAFIGLFRGDNIGKMLVRI